LIETVIFEHVVTILLVISLCINLQ